jgi:hypothetical protein
MALNDFQHFEGQGSASPEGCLTPEDGEFCILAEMARPGFGNRGAAQKPTDG